MKAFRFRLAARFGVIFVVAVVAVLMVDIAAGLALKPEEVSIVAEMRAGFRAVAAMDPDEKVRNPDYLAEKFLTPNFWFFGPLVKDFKRSRAFIKVYRVSRYFTANAATRHIDSILKRAAANGIVQVVNLGAGYDSRAYRYRKLMPQVKFFEVELPEMVIEKKQRLKKVLGEVPDYVAFVPIDFNIQTIPGELAKASYDLSLKTLFIWEGVTMYISADAVDSTLKFITTQSGPGSEVVFDYMPDAVIRGDFSKYKDVRGLAFWVRYRGEPFTFGIAEGKSAAYVQQRGLIVLSDIGPAEMTARYLTLSNGNPFGPCSSGFRMMHATARRRASPAGGW